MPWVRSVGCFLIRYPSAGVDSKDRYKSKEASRVAHRQSEQYKTFRSAVGTEELLESPSDLEFWHSTSIGFLTKGGQVLFAPGNDGQTPQYAVTDELAVAAASKQQSLDHLRQIAETARLEPSVLTFWVLDRESPDSSSGDAGNNLYLLMRFHSKSHYNAYRQASSRAEWEAIGSLTTSRKTTTWEAAGIGFLGR